MYPTNPVASQMPAVILQLNIFGDVDEIPVKPPKLAKATLSVQRLSTTTQAHH
jgi:hypothetical protein